MEKNTKLIIIIPAYNEEASIAQVIQDIPRKIDRIDEIAVFVINDGSTDTTIEKARQAGADRIINNPQRQGLAKTFHNGLSAALRASADIIINIDADNQYRSDEIPKLIQPIINNGADMVIGDRQVGKLQFMKPGNKYGNLIGSWVLRKLTGSRIKDASSGFRAFSKKAALNLNLFFSHTYTHETIIQAIYKDLKITEVPVEFRERMGGKSRLINNLYTHIKNSSLVIARTILMYKPLKTLFYAGFIIMTPGIFLGLRFVYYYLYQDSSGKIQSLILAAMLIIIGFFVIILGLIGDIIAKNRKINEEILTRLKKNEINN